MVFSEFQCDFKSSHSTPDLLTVISDRIASAFNRAQAVVLDISKAFDRVLYVSLLCKLKSSRSSGQVFCLILSFCK